MGMVALKIIANFFIPLLLLLSKRMKIKKWNEKHFFFFGDADFPIKYFCRALSEKRVPEGVGFYTKIPMESRAVNAGRPAFPKVLGDEKKCLFSD